MTAKALWLLVLAYPASGLLLGLADPVLGRLAQSVGTRPGVATAVSVNLLLPLTAAILGVLYARLPAVWLGAVAMTLGLGAGLAVQYGLPTGIPPVLVAATLGYAAIGTIAALLRRLRPA
jgi:hypothetical protein